MNLQIKMIVAKTGGNLFSIFPYFPVHCLIVFLGLATFACNAGANKHLQSQRSDIGTLFISTDESAAGCFSLPQVDSIINTVYLEHMRTLLPKLVAPESIQNIKKQLSSKDTTVVWSIQKFLPELKSRNISYLIIPQVTENGKLMLVAYFVSDTSKVGYATCNCSAAIMLLDSICKNPIASREEIKNTVAKAIDATMFCLMQKIARLPLTTTNQ